jgi:Tol biopolymer transport system component
MRLALPALTGLLAMLAWLPAAPAQDSKPVKPTNLPVNTEADEDEPHVADGGLTLYFTSPVKGKEDIWVARRRTASQPWPKKSEILGPYVRTGADDRSCFSTEGSYPLYLFFATKKDKEAKNYDIYAAVKMSSGAVFSAPTPVNAVDTEADELHPWLTADGRSLYFSRKTKDGWRVFVATRPGKTGPGGWDDPKMVELPENFHHATLSPDGKTMYLQGPLEGGRWGLFVSTRAGKEWGKPVELTELNDKEAKTGDRSPNLSRDGKFLYFASDRPGGKGGLDLWVVPVSALKKR